MADEVKLVIGGKAYSGWKNVSISRNMESLCGEFQFTIIDSLDTKGIKVGDECSIKIGDELVCTGYIFKRTKSADANSKALSFSGRDKTADLVDCSATPKSGGWNKVDLKQICSDVCSPFGITVKVEGSVGEKFSSFKVDAGETCLELIDRACKQRSLIPLSTSDGNLLLTTTATQDSGEGLLYGEGGNILILQEEIDVSSRFSEYTLKGQKSGGGNVFKAEKATQVSHKATDPGVVRFRPLMIQADNQVNVSTAKAMVSWESQVRAGRSRVFTATVNGWKNSAGNLWERNILVLLKATDFEVNELFLITEVQFSLGDDGRKTTLSLKSPITYSENPSDKVKPASTKGGNPFKK